MLPGGSRTSWSPRELRLGDRHPSRSPRRPAVTDLALGGRLILVVRPAGIGGAVRRGRRPAPPRLHAGRSASRRALARPGNLPQNEWLPEEQVRIAPAPPRPRLEPLDVGRRRACRRARAGARPSRGRGRRAVRARRRLAGAEASGRARRAARRREPWSAPTRARGEAARGRRSGRTGRRLRRRSGRPESSARSEAARPAPPPPAGPRGVLGRRASVGALAPARKTPEPPLRGRRGQRRPSTDSATSALCSSLLPSTIWNTFASRR